MHEQGFRLVRISGVDEGGMQKVLVGFYALPETTGEPHRYDFYPVDFESSEEKPAFTSINLLRFMVSLATDLPENEILQGFEDWFEEFQDQENKKGIQLISSGRVPAFLPFRGWENEAGDSEVSKRFFNLFGIESEAEQSSEILIWSTKLSFSDSYKLYEVISRDSSNPSGKATHFRRSYFLGRKMTKNWGYLDLKSIDGTSAVIHSIWNENTLESPTFLIEDNTSVVDYLRFFCWAIEGESTFPVPLDYYDLPFNKVPEQRQKEELKKLWSGDQTITISEDSYHYLCRGKVVYSNIFFESDFQISKMNGGAIEMLNQKFLVKDLPFRIEQFKGPYLYIALRNIY